MLQKLQKQCKNVVFLPSKRCNWPSQFKHIFLPRHLKVDVFEVDGGRIQVAYTQVASIQVAYIQVAYIQVAYIQVVDASTMCPPFRWTRPPTSKNKMLKRAETTFVKNSCKMLLKFKMLLNFIF